MLDMEGYSALSFHIQQHTGILFPNDAVNRTGRVVFAEELESNVDNYGEDCSNNNNNGGRGNRALMMFRSFENG